MKTKGSITSCKSEVYTELENILGVEDVVSSLNSDRVTSVNFLEKRDFPNVEQFNRTLERIKSQNKRLVDFTRIASHNLRSHASNLEGILNILTEAKTEEEREELIGYLKNISFGLNETISNIDELACIQWTTGIVIEKINLLEVVMRCKNVLCFDISSTNTLIYIDVDAEINLLHNPAYLESIILNLMSNAIKYRSEKRNPIIRIKAKVIGREVVFEVKDNGKGINMEKYGKVIFGLYKTFHGNNDSKGYGLYITKSQVEALGGSINLISNESFGSTFFIHFIYESTISN
jgi:hypothetical protein